MVIRKIVAGIKSRSRSFVLNLVIRLAWSVLISVLLTVLLVFSAFLLVTTGTKPKPSLSQILIPQFGESFIFFLSLALPITVTAYILQAISRSELEWEPGFAKRVNARIRQLHIETRILIDNGLKWTNRLIFLIAFLIMLLWLGGIIVSDKSLDPWAYPLVLAILTITVFLTTFRHTLMTRFDWAVLYFEQFMREREKGAEARDRLIKAFRNYNRLLGSTVPMNRLWQLCGSTIEAYKIGDDESRKQMDETVTEIIHRLKSKEVNHANRCLIQLAESTTEITERHKELLGLKVRYPLRYRLGDLFRELMNKILIPFVIFLLSLLVWIVLSRLGLFPVTPQSPPF